VAAGLLAAAALPARGARAADPTPRTTLTPDQALRLLKEGNDNFRMEAPFRAAQGRERRVELARGQAPFCVLVGCSDSRVPPELLFGRGPGTIDHAGHTVAFRSAAPPLRGPHTLSTPPGAPTGSTAIGLIAELGPAEVIQRFLHGRCRPSAGARPGQRRWEPRRRNGGAAHGP
jgi:carbonic anhydrase